MWLTALLCVLLFLLLSQDVVVLRTVWGREPLPALVIAVRHALVAGCFWAWWRSQPPPQLHPNIRPYCRARKYLSSGAQWVNVPKDVVEDLVVASKHSVLSSTETLQTVNGCFSMPRTLVQSLVEVIDACVEGIPYVPLDEANMQARGLGSMVAFWERMRHICPKVNIYHGPIFGKDGGQCVTSQDLDEAMLATRDFWFQSPVEHDETWQPILDRYAEGEPWAPFSPPDEEVFLNMLLHTKDSAPGPDGLPYSAWRLLPKVTVEAMKSCFYDIINGTVGVWIPKAKMGPEADSFRPLGMPNTLERLVDGSVAAHAMKQTAHTMHSSQAVMSCLKNLRKLSRAFRKFLMVTLPQLLFSLICPKHLRGLTPFGSLSCSGLEGHRGGCMHMPNLSCSTAESHTKYKEGFCRAEQSCKVLTWGGPSQCTYSAWPWTRCSLT